MTAAARGWWVKGAIAGIIACAVYLVCNGVLLFYLARIAVGYLGMPRRQVHAVGPSFPTGDYHQHLLSPAMTAFLKAPKPFMAADLIPLLDQAHVRRAVLLSLAYQYGNPYKQPVADEYVKVKAENDWTAAQAAVYPDRLVAFCGVNPLRDYAVAEVDRCAASPDLKTGLKLHFGNSDVDLDNPEHVAKLRKVFAAADRHGMAIVVHLHANVDHHKAYGATEARVFLKQVMPSAPHVVIQIAHLAGAGGYDDPADDQALSVFVQAIAAHDAAVRNLYVDISGVAGVGQWKGKKELLAQRIRAIGIQRILYGSDGAWTDFTPTKAVAAFHQLPLSAEELRAIDANEPPYVPMELDD